jgi:hypothetical protein
MKYDGCMEGCILPHQSNITFESQSQLPDILPTYYNLAVSDVMLNDTCQKVYGICVLKTILGEGRRKGGILEFWG